MSTSVIKSSPYSRRKTTLCYLILTAFLFAFSRIYEHLSYGEVSIFMHNLFLVPLIGGGSLLAAHFFLPQLSRLSFNLWNSGIAVLTTGCLLRGIINLSGRSTTLDKAYWLTGFGFLTLAAVSTLWDYKIKGKEGEMFDRN